jgi:hypothetical protein
MAAKILFSIKSTKKFYFKKAPNSPNSRPTVLVVAKGGKHSLSYRDLISGKYDRVG